MINDEEFLFFFNIVTLLTNIKSVSLARREKGLSLEYLSARKYVRVCSLCNAVHEYVRAVNRRISMPAKGPGQ